MILNYKQAKLIVALLYDVVNRMGDGQIKISNDLYTKEEIEEVINILEGE